MLDLTKYEGMNECAELVREIKQLREAATQFAEVAELMMADAEPIHPGVVQCGELCRTKARDALEAYRGI